MINARRNSKPIIPDSWSPRGKAILLDFASLAVLAFITSQILEIILNESGVQDTSYYFFGWTAVVYGLFLNKDMLHGMSIGKTIAGFRVIVLKTGDTASPLRCLVRNLFLILGPVELVVLLYSENRRIGDFVAGTTLVSSGVSAQSGKVNYAEVVLACLVSFALIYVAAYFFG